MFRWLWNSSNYNSTKTWLFMKNEKLGKLALQVKVAMWGLGQWQNRSLKTDLLQGEKERTFCLIITSKPDRRPYGNVLLCCVGVGNRERVVWPKIENLMPLWLRWIHKRSVFILLSLLQISTFFDSMLFQFHKCTYTNVLNVFNTI